MICWILRGLGVLIAVQALAACEQTKPRCRRSSECQESGLCTARGDECIAESDADCGRATICIVQGQCKARDGECVKR